jgi:Tol biopolymer transport system component
MPIEIGMRIGPYEIVGWLGAGGMGDVYRARDARLGRDVAIKLIAETLAADATRVRRFEQEARAAGQINHPNILAVYDAGVHEGAPYIVAELLEGQPLRGLLKNGALAARKAVDYARQTAEGLAAAHDLGIVHRDVKPDNLFITSDGRLKILDFGIAKLTQPKDTEPGRTGLPTDTIAGTIVGTAGYMSPEQVRGDTVDARSDIFNVGAVLYEMLSGHSAFARATTADTMAAILKEEPSGDFLFAVPPALARIVTRCLEKAREARFQSARDLAFSLEVLSGGTGTAALPSPPGGSGGRRSWVYLPWAVAAVAIVTAAGLWTFSPQPPEREAPLTVLAATAPPGASFTSEEAPLISPDGRRLAFVAYDASGIRQLYTRDVYPRVVNVADAQPLANTDGASLPFWSPNSQSLGFFAQGKLKTVNLATGSLQTLAPAAGARGGTWNQDGVIVYVPRPLEGPYRIPATGGTPTQVASDAGPFPRGWFPSFLPDGRHFLIFVLSGRPEQTGIFLASLDSPKRKQLIAGRSHGVYAAPGYLLFWREATLMAQPFDATKLELTGNAVAVAPAAGLNPVTNQALFSVSNTGTLVLFSGAAVQSELVWVNRAGTQIGTASQKGVFTTVALSPDGKQVVYDLADARTATLDLWRLIFSRAVPSKLTFNSGSDIFPVFSADGSRIAYASVREGPPQLYALDADGPGNETLLLQSNLPKVPTGWSHDGKLLIHTVVDPKTGGDIWVLTLDGARASPIVNTAADERYGTLSPDGRWLAYVSNETGSYEVYVQAFPRAGRLRQVSSKGGLQPEWRPDGRELFYLAPDKNLMAVDMGPAGAALDPRAPKELFATRTMCLEIQPTARTYAAADRGQRFLLANATGQAQSEPIRVVLNWDAALRR